MASGGRALLKPNLEALRLYREILKTAKKFYWPNENGEPW